MKVFPFVRLLYWGGNCRFINLLGFDEYRERDVVEIKVFYLSNQIFWKTLKRLYSKES